MTPYEDLPAVMTVREVADVLRCSERTVRNRIAEGRICSVRLGRLVRVTRTDLLAALEQRKGKRPSTSAEKK